MVTFYSIIARLLVYSNRPTLIKLFNFNKLAMYELFLIIQAIQLQDFCYSIRRSFLQISFLRRQEEVTYHFKRHSIRYRTQNLAISDYDCYFGFIIIVQHQGDVSMLLQWSPSHQKETCVYLQRIFSLELFLPIADDKCFQFQTDHASIRSFWPLIRHKCCVIDVGMDLISIEFLPLRS